MSSLVNLIYASSAACEMTSDDLLQILAKAREKNGRLNITGMLLYRGGNFLQVLEGEKSTVESLFEVIRQDPRHRAVSQLSLRPVTERGFGAWEMGFMHLDKVDPATIPGYTTYLKEPLNSERFKDENFAATFLRLFKEGMR